MGVPYKARKSSGRSRVPVAMKPPTDSFLSPAACLLLTLNLYEDSAGAKMFKVLAWFWLMSMFLHVATSRNYCREKCPLFDPPNRVILLPGPKRWQFYMCRFGVGILFKCSPGTHFNPRRQTCDWPLRARAVKCSRSPDFEGEGSGDYGHVRLY